MGFHKPIPAIAIGGILLFSGLAQAKSVWRKVQTPFQGQINGVAMSPDGKHIILSGGFTLHSSDRGVTWEQVGSAPEIMTFGDNTHLFAVGSSQGCNLPNGTAGMLRSTDYGKTWSGTSVRTPMCFREVFFLDSLHGWSVGYEKDSVMFTKDGGKTLQGRYYGVSGIQVNGVSFLDTLQGWAAGWVIGADSAILQTTDGGNNWMVQSLGVAASVAGISINFPDSLRGWFFASYDNDEHIFVSSDGGRVWNERPKPLHHTLWQLQGIDSLRCWMIGDYFGPKIWKTSDAAQTWDLEYDGPGGFLLDFDMADSAHGVAAGDLGTVLIYAPLILGDLNADEEITAADVVLELNKVFLGQPFPSPEEAGDVNCDGLLTSADVVELLNLAFLGIPGGCF